jgi:hypothetical protein
MGKEEEEDAEACSAWDGLTSVNVWQLTDVAVLGFSPPHEFGMHPALPTPGDLLVPRAAGSLWSVCLDPAAQD